MLRTHASRKEILLECMFRSGLIDPSFDVGSVPDFPEHLDGKIYVGDELKKEGKITRLPPYLWLPLEFDQIQSSSNPSVVSRWKANPAVLPHWVCGAGFIDGPLTGEFLPDSPMGFGDALCVVVQHPEVGRCRVEQPKRLRLQAYELHRNRFVVDMQPFQDNQYHHNLGMLWDSLRTFTGDRANVRYLHPSMVVA